jgi:hypothetical protein
MGGRATDLSKSLRKLGWGGLDGFSDNETSSLATVIKTGAL